MIRGKARRAFSAGFNAVKFSNYFIYNIPENGFTFLVSATPKEARDAHQQQVRADCPQTRFTHQNTRAVPGRQNRRGRTTSASSTSPLRLKPIPNLFQTALWLTVPVNVSGAVIFSSPVLRAWLGLPAPAHTFYGVLIGF
jgi:hypothetical protein